MSIAKSVRESALCAVKEALEAEGTPATSVFRSQLDHIEQKSLPCYDVSPGDEKPDSSYEDHDSEGRILQVTVRGIVDATESDDSALDPFYVFAMQHLVGESGNLNGAVDEVVAQGGPVVFKPEGKDILGIELVFDLKFTTKRGDPTQRG